MTYRAIAAIPIGEFKEGDKEEKNCFTLVNQVSYKIAIQWQHDLSLHRILANIFNCSQNTDINNNNNDYHYYYYNINNEKNPISVGTFYWFFYV